MSKKIKISQLIKVTIPNFVYTPEALLKIGSSITDFAGQTIAIETNTPGVYVALFRQPDLFIMENKTGEDYFTKYWFDDNETLQQTKCYLKS